MDLTEAAVSTTAFRHPWELSRTESILKILRPLPRGLRYADIGSGDMYFSGRVVEELRAEHVWAVDPYLPKSASTKSITALSDISELPDGQVDVVFLMDVLEHIEDDRAFLAAVAAKVKSGAIVFITVPAHQYLFSAHDRFLKHFRRYSLGGLRAVALAAGLEVEREFGFYSSLYFVRLLQVIRERLAPAKVAAPQKGIAGWRFSQASPITVLIKSVLNFDFSFLKLMSFFRIHIPGTSLCMICKKK